MLVPKLRDWEEREWKRLSLQDGTLMEDIGYAPHLVYANLRFDSSDENVEPFIEWCQLVGPAWGKQRIVKYLSTHQEQFRECLRWLIEDALVDFDEFRRELGRASKSFRESDLENEWRKTPEVRFLQLHGLAHSTVSIRPKFGPKESGEWFFSGIDLGPRKSKDPLDRICWHLLHLLFRDGHLNARQCKFCETFFRPRTKRRWYCSDLCRIKANAKSPKEAREYMRKYRQGNEARRRRRLSAGH